MQRRPLAFAVAFALVAGTVIVPGVGAAGRPTCLVSNERTHLGSTTLQAGIDAARAGDTLIVKGTCVGSGLDPYQNANFTIDRDLTLEGVSNKAFGQATLDGGLSGAVLWVRPHLTVTLIGLTITNGFTVNGSFGGLFNEGSAVALIDTTVTGNRAWNAAGIGNYFYGTMTLTNSTVSGNTAMYGGGGIYNAGTMSLTNSTVSGNTSLNSGGGGILNVRSLTLTSSTISDNTAKLGGGILNAGSEYGLGVLTVTSSTVGDNTANGAGGGIYNAGTAAITDSRVSDNTAFTGGGIVNVRGYLADPATLAVTGSTVSGNTATGSGGGIANGAVLGEASIVTLTDSALAGNATPHNGGGIYNRGTLAIEGSTVSLNVANLGGGISNDGVLTFAARPTTIGANAANSEGGGIWNGRGTVAGGCPAPDGNVNYDPPNTPTNYVGFTCPMPVPKLATSGTFDFKGSDGNLCTYYKLAVTNWADYTPDLFTPAPDLPSCGSNTNSSRTWVWIHRASDSSRMYGYCAFEKPSDLTQMGFAMLQGTPPPAGMYVTLTDRRTNQIVTSNTVSFAP